MTGDTADESTRPRPRFGEYATPEEQASRIRQPDVTDRLGAGEDPGDRHRDHLAAPGAARASMADRIATWALLGYGLFTVLGAIPTLTDYGAFAATVLSGVGVDAPPDAAAGGRWWALAAVIVLGAGWLATAVLSLRRLREGRLAFWIPLVGGLACNAVASVLLMVPLVTDTTILELVREAALAPPS